MRIICLAIWLGLAATLVANGAQLQGAYYELVAVDAGPGHHVSISHDLKPGDCPIVANHLRELRDGAGQPVYLTITCLEVRYPR